jgi:hypothetical protein
MQGRLEGGKLTKRRNGGGKAQVVVLGKEEKEEARREEGEKARGRKRAGKTFRNRVHLEFHLHFTSGRRNGPDAPVTLYIQSLLFVTT